MGASAHSLLRPSSDRACHLAALPSPGLQAFAPPEPCRTRSSPPRAGSGWQRGARIPSGAPDRALMYEPVPPTSPHRPHLFPTLRSRVHAWEFLPVPLCLSRPGRLGEPSQRPSVPRAAPDAGSGAGSRPDRRSAWEGLTANAAERLIDRQSPSPPAPAVVEPFGWRTLHTLGMGVVCAPAYPDCTSAERHQGEIRRCEIRARSG